MLSSLTHAYLFAARAASCPVIPFFFFFLDIFWDLLYLLRASFGSLFDGLESVMERGMDVKVEREGILSLVSYSGGREA